MSVLRPILSAVFSLALALAFSGCATTSEDAYFRGTKSNANVYVAPVASPITKVAVMPFKAPTELVGASVADLFVTEMLRAGRYELVERSQMARVLSEAELAMAGLSAARAAEVGALLGADGVIIGTVDEYSTVAIKGKTYAVVGITARLIDVATGKVMWSVDLAKRADAADKTLPLLAREVVHEMTAGLYQKWAVQKTVRAPRSPAAGPAPSEKLVVRPPPGPVQGFAVDDQGLREVRIRWSKAPDARRVRIERALKPEGPFEVVGEVSADDGTFVDRGSKNKPLADSTTYYYRLTAISADGQVSPVSEVKESMTAPPPDPPRNVKAEPHGSRAVQVTWDAPRSEGIAKYEIQRAPADKPDSFVRAGEVFASPFHEGERPDSPLADSTEYLYRVRAINRVGAVGEFSQPVRVKTEPPPAPIRTLAAQSGGVRCVPLSWDASEEANVVAYEIWRADAESGPFALVGTVKGRANTKFLDGQRDPGTLADERTYFYFVSAVNAVTARSGTGNVVSATTRPPPPVVEGLAGVGGRPRQVPLTWNASPDEKVIGYLIERAGPTAASFTQIADVKGRATTSWTDRGGQEDNRKLGRLADRAIYRYRIAAYNTAHARSAWSPEISVETKPAPARPVLEWASTNQPRRIAIEWQSNPEPDISEYHVEVAESAQGKYREAGAVTAPKNSFTHKNLPDGAARWYRIRAVDVDGLESPWSEPLRGNARPAPPAPRNLSVEWGEAGAVLSWTMPEGAPLCRFRILKLGLIGMSATPIGETEEMSLTINAETVGKGIKVCLVALDEDNLESARSAALEIRPPSPPAESKGIPP